MPQPFSEIKIVYEYKKEEYEIIGCTKDDIVRKV